MMPEMPDVIQGNPVAADWGNEIRSRTLQRYADAAARSVEHPLPVAGDLAWLDAEQVAEVWNGAAWVLMTATPPVGPRAVKVIRFGATATMPIGDSSQLIDYDISGFGFPATNVLVLAILGGANNQQSQRTLITGQFTSATVLTVWLRGLNITAAGGCFFQVTMTEYDQVVGGTPTPPILP